MGTISSILINIFSSYFYDKLDSWSDKKDTQNFLAELSEWIKDFEQKNDGTIITKSIFISYIENFGVLQSMLKYVLDASENKVGESAFLKNLQKNFALYAAGESVHITPFDESVLKEFFSTVFNKMKSYIYGKADNSARAVLYCLVQTRLDIQEAAALFNVTEETLNRLEDEILDIRIAQNKRSYSDDWFIKQNNDQIKNLGKRYLPKLNIPTNTSRIFDGLARNDEFYRRLEENTDAFLMAVKRAKINECEALTDSVQKHVVNVLQGIENELRSDDLIHKAEELQRIIRENLDHLFAKYSREKDMDVHSSIPEKDHMKIYNWRDAYGHIGQYIDYLESDEVRAFQVPYILIYGEGGCGKSHLLADAVKNRSVDNYKSVLFLGQHFKLPTDPITAMMQLIDSKDTFEDFLDSMNKIGEQESHRVVIFIDAINEGDGKAIWKEHLSGVLEKIKRYPWIALVMSIRSEYRKPLFSENNALSHEFLHVWHRGFRQIRYQAIKKYFAYYDINYMEIPINNPEFDNPLFLRLFCEAYEGESINLTEINLKDVYEKYLGKINERISEKCEVNYRYKIVQKTVRSIVTHKFKENAGNNVISIDEVMDIVLEIQKKFDCKVDLLEQLLSEGVLTQNILWTGDEYIYITYERMDDYIYAELLCEELDRISPKEFTEQHEDLINYPGILNCFAIETALNAGKEIFEIYDGTELMIKEAFIDSLKWRRDSVVSGQTKDYIENHILGDENINAKYFDVLILVGTRKDYALNADYLTAHVYNMTMPDRDAFFIPMFNELFRDKECSINRLLDWGMGLNVNEKVLDETLRLAALTLSIFLISSNRLLRDKATKSMINILKGHMDIVIYLLNQFKEIDDPYVVERLYAVAFGCVVSEKNNDQIHALAKAVYENIFAVEVVYPNILVRDYALNIIDYAEYRLGAVDFDTRRCEPPYHTSMPKIPTDDEISCYEYDYKSPDFQNYYWAQNAIISSMHVEYTRNGKTGGYGDFGRYTFQRYFSQWSKLNYKDLENIAVKKIFDMGYDVEKHGEFDNSIGGGRSSSNVIERIGKKYQWIALYELAAQVSDNYKMDMEDSRYTGKEEDYCRGTYRSDIRNLDPTVSLITTVAEKRIHNKLYKMPSISNDKWLENFNDLPRMLQMICRTLNNQKFLLLNGWYSWEEQKKIGEERYQNPTKSMWVQINSYIVKKDKLINYINKLKHADFMGRYLSEPHDNYSLYNKEYYWSHGYRSFQNPYYRGGEWTSLDKYGEDYSDLPNVLVPTVKYITERDGDMLYQGGHSTWYKPCLELFDGLHMRYGKENSVLYNESGKILCFDSIELLKEDIGFFIDQKEFFKYLDENGYSIFWTLLAEKSVIVNSFSTTNPYPMPHISGLFYLSNDGKLVGRMHGMKTD